MMKTLEEYLKIPYRMELIPDLEDGGFVASYPDLPGCISSGDTIESAIDNINDAKKQWIMAAIEDGYHIPENSIEDYSGQFKLRIPKSLHRLLSEKSKQEGTSMNQYCLYLLSKNL